MISSISFARLLRRVYVQREAEQSPAVARARQHLDHAAWDVVDCISDVPPEHLRSTTLYLTNHRGRALARCPGSRGHRCCNYLTVDLYTGCPLGCDYCIMRSYLNSSPLSVNVDVERIAEEILDHVARHQGTDVRIGTGEVGDSLLFDPVFDLSRTLVESLAPWPRAALELKTKTAEVDHLLDIPHKGRAVLGFSVNPQPLVEAAEGMAAPLSARMSAARRSVKAGYRVSFHFDPIIHSRHWRPLYAGLVKELGDFPGGSIAWISLGCFRYTPGLKRKLGHSPLLLDEFVLCADGKYRYVQRQRVAMYTHLLEGIRGSTDAPVYLCMESLAVWRAVFGAAPEEIPELHGIFNPDRGVY